MTPIQSDQNAGVRVRIVGDHPHRGATGTIKDWTSMRMGMYEVDLDPGPGLGGASGCFADLPNLQRLHPNEDPDR